MEKIVVERAGNLSAAEIIKSHHPERLELFLARCTGTDTGSMEIRDTGEQVRINPEGKNTKETVAALKAYVARKGSFRGTYWVDTDKGTFRISAFAKTDEFGGGAGIAGGSEQTKIVEAGQCIACASASYAGTPEFISHVSLGKGETIDGIQTAMQTLDDIWQIVIEKTAKELTSQLPKEGYWHWQDSFVKSIQVTYSSLEDKLAGSFDRYNPADIWYTDQPYEYINNAVDLKEVNKLEDLTTVLNQAYDEGRVVGISLKKTTEPSIERYTADRRDTKFDIEKLSVEKRKDDTLTMNIPFTVDGIEYLCQIRRDNKSYRATVKGKKETEHYDGSVGRGIIIHCLEKICNSTEDLDKCYPSYWYDELEKELDSYILNHQSKFDIKDVDEAEDMLEGIYPVDAIEKEPKKIDGKYSIPDQAIANSLDAIYDILSKATENERKEFLGRLVRYMWSIHTSSCNFLKVH